MKHRLIGRAAGALAFVLLLTATAHVRPLALTSDLASSQTRRTAVGAQPAAARQDAGSLCRPDEQTIFNCRTVARGAPKYVSLCGSKRLDDKQSYVQYRFGRRDGIELAFPDERTSPRDVFRYAHYFRAQVNRTEIVFVNGGYKYTLYDYYDGEDKPAVEAAGVRVSRADSGGNEETGIRCRGRAEEQLHVLEEILPRDEGNALNLGN